MKNGGGGRKISKIERSRREAARKWLLYNTPGSSLRSELTLVLGTAETWAVRDSLPDAFVERFT